MVSGGYLDGVWRVSGGCLEGVWGMSAGCQEVVWGCVWGVSVGCLQGVWRLSGGCLGDVWRVSGGCLEGVRRLSGGASVKVKLHSMQVVPPGGNFSSNAIEVVLPSANFHPFPALPDLCCSGMPGVPFLTNYLPK